MANLVHLIYCSTATRSLSNADLLELLRVARERNRELGVTGMLLYENGGFFQVIEGEAAVINRLYAMIEADERHHHLVKIIHEPIARRVFADWTMGFSRLHPSQVGEIVGANDFFDAGESLASLDTGRAKKILTAFREGRWRARIESDAAAALASAPGQPVGRVLDGVRFRFQPVIDIRQQSIFSQAVDAVAGGHQDYAGLLRQIHPYERAHFDSECRTRAIERAASLGLDCHLTVNFVSGETGDSADLLRFTLETAERHGIDPARIILEVDLERSRVPAAELARVIRRYRGSGMKSQLGQFVSASGMLELLHESPPDLVALNSHLTRKVSQDGSRQALLRAIVQACDDLGIDVVARQVEREEDFEWLRHEGIDLFQGDLLARMQEGELPVRYQLPGSRN